MRYDNLQYLISGLPRIWHLPSSVPFIPRIWALQMCKVDGTNLNRPCVEMAVLRAGRVGSKEGMINRPPTPGTSSQIILDLREWSDIPYPAPKYGTIEKFVHLALPRTRPSYSSVATLWHLEERRNCALFHRLNEWSLISVSIVVYSIYGSIYDILRTCTTRSSSFPPPFDANRGWVTRMRRRTRPWMNVHIWYSVLPTEFIVAVYFYKIYVSLISDLILIREHWSTDELFH